MNFFVNGLVPSIQTIVARFHEMQQRRSFIYNAVVQFARDEVEAYPAGRCIGRDTRNRRNRNPKNIANLLQDEGNIPDNGQHYEVHIIGGGDDGTLDFIPTDDLP